MSVTSSPGALERLRDAAAAAVDAAEVSGASATRPTLAESDAWTVQAFAGALVVRVASRPDHGSSADGQKEMIALELTALRTLAAAVGAVGVLVGLPLVDNLAAAVVGGMMLSMGVSVAIGEQEH